MSFVRQLLFSIADQMGRPRKDMENFINTLQKNWYDTPQSLKTLSPQDCQRFGIPARLVNIIMEKIQKSNNNSQPQQSKNSVVNSKNNGFSMDVEFDILAELAFLKKQVNQNQFNTLVDIIFRVFSNVRNSITQEKYRTLKKSNQKIGQLVKYKQLVMILEYGGFEDCGQFYIMKTINLGRIQQCVEKIAREHQGSKFDPYKSQITSMTGKNFEQITNTADSSVIFNEKLAELQKERQRLMSKLIKDRDAKIFKANELKPKFKENDYGEEKQLNEEQQIYAESIKQRLKKAGEDPKFMNRRKLQYLELMKKPCYSQTIIRVKLPQDLILQAKFSPLEPVQKLLEFVHELMEDKNMDYYVYMTPPVQKLKGRITKSTFYDLNCVPSGVFYLGSQKPLTRNPLKLKTNKLFGIF